jgi:hypothetical protein
VADQDNNGESSSANDSVIAENISSEIWNFGRPTFKCQHCNALLWHEERIRPNTRSRNPSFGICCGNGKIRLPARLAPPAFLQEILNGEDMRSKNYRKIYGHIIQCLHSHLLEG